ncbi:hypothetical protein VTI74DRAFT_8863 [Chaetomium olivicolor]
MFEGPALSVTDGSLGLLGQAQSLRSDAIGRPLSAVVIGDQAGRRHATWTHNGAGTPDGPSLPSLSATPQPPERQYGSNEGTKLDAAAPSLATNFSISPLL